MSSLIQPVLRDDALLQDIRSATTLESPHLRVWWLGQSGFLISFQKQFLLFDPYLSDSLSEKYLHTDKPHTRLTERVIHPSALDFVQVVTSTHNHTDHLDRETLLPLRQANPGLQLIIPEANRTFVAERLGTDPQWPIGLVAGGQVTAGAMVFHGIPACHNTLETDESGRHRFMGYVVEIGPWRVYHSGDTLHYPGLEDCLRPWKLDLALLPINGNRPERRVAGNLNGEEAARLARAVDAKWVVPCHFDMFAFNTASPLEFESECQRLGQAFKTMKAGERWELRA
jgi:L-ascorbate metabolism protein UlaG (beta-lactamase superfamily)